MTKLQQVVERLYAEVHGASLTDWVRTQREAGKSWARIAKQLEASIDVELTDVTLMTWFAEPEPDQSPTH